MNSIDDNELSITPAGQSGGLFYFPIFGIRRRGAGAGEFHIDK